MDQGQHPAPACAAESGQTPVNHDVTPVSELAPGDRVVLCAPTSGLYAEAALALLTRGIFPVPVDPALSRSEFDDVLATVRPARVASSVADLAELRALGPDSLTGALPLGRPMHLTSGTTGRRKAVFSGLLAPAAAQALVDEERDLWGFTADEVHLVVSPLYHSAPLRFAMSTLIAGGRLVVPGPFDPATLSRLLSEESVTSAFVVPTHLQRLFAHWDHVGVPDLRSMRTLAHAGAPCPPAVKEQMVALFPPRTTWEFYGSTEGQFTAVRSEDQAAHPGTVGRARPGRVMHADEDGRLWCVVPPHARFTYFEAPDKNAQTWRETPLGPAFTLGDVGRVDEDGWVYLAGRRTDLIITGGVNVYPLEVENVLRQYPGVVDVAVHGRDDPEWGQQVCAVVVEAPGAGVDLTDLAAWARGQLPGPRRPKEYRLADALPRNSTGKVLRERL